MQLQMAALGFCWKINWFVVQVCCANEGICWCISFWPGVCLLKYHWISASWIFCIFLRQSQLWPHSK